MRVLRVLVAAVVVAWMGADMLVAGQDTNTDTTSTVWTPGRITQITLAAIEAALLTFILLFPGIMDPIVNFINSNIGPAQSRRRREVESVLMEQAAAVHNLLLDAVDRFEDMHYALSSPLS